MSVNNKLPTVALVLVLAAASFAITACGYTESPGKPNIILIIADDMRKDDLEHMPKTQSQLVDRGVEYSNAFVTTAQCCPSRSSILRGQYVHNHGVTSNAPPEGGWEKFEALGNESSTVATWLDDAGYETILIGKYMNNYVRPEQVPPGWDEWYARFKGEEDALYYDYGLSENGTVVDYGAGEEDYSTDVLAEKAKDFIRRSGGDSQPFFMYLSPTAPHDPHVNAPRHDGMFEDVQAPRPPSFDEADVSDKPAWVRDLPSKKEDVDEVFRKRLRMLQAMDEMVEGVVKELSSAGRLENTYIFFASDNGWHLGEHGITFEKNTPYEESIRVPLVVRGPGIPPGRISDQMALNIDLGPTFADLGGAAVPPFVDGRSIRPTFAVDAPSWRTAFLEEVLHGKPVPEHKAVRTATHKYIEYTEVEGELYDLEADPYEVNNLYDDADPSLVADLKSRLEALRECTGESCRAAENRP